MTAKKYGFTVEFDEDELNIIIQIMREYYGFEDSRVLMRFLLFKEHRRLIRKGYAKKE
jgi:hypothetical protein